MATSAAEIDFVPDEVDFVPDEIDFVPDEVIAEEAQRASAGALQAVDVIAAPRRFDWSEVNEELDRQRLAAAREAEASAEIAANQGSGTGPGSTAFGFRREAEFQRGQMLPTTAAGRTVEQEGQQELESIRQTGETAARPGTPAELLSGFLGPGLSANVQPTVEAAGRKVGAATGGILGALALTPTPIGTASRLSSLVATALPLSGALMGSLAGESAQETTLQTTETSEETQARHQRNAEAAAQNPNAELVGGMMASSPFFGPSIAQFGRAAAGDKAAITNLGIAGVIGGGMEVASAMVQGRTADAKDIAAGIFSNLIMNEPTRLGRKLGLPSSEPKFQEVESGIKPIGGETDAQQISETGTPDGGVRAPEIPSQNALVPPVEGSQGVQPVRQGEPLAQGAPEAPRQIAPGAKLLGTAVRLPDGTPMQGNQPAQSHQELILSAIEQGDPDGTTGYMPKNEDLGFAVQNPDGSVAFVDRTQGAQIAKENGIIPPEAPDTLTSEVLQEFTPKSTPTDEERIAKLVEAGMTPEDAAAGLARIKAAEAPPTPPAEPSAPAVEAAPLDPNATSNKEAVVNAERVARELDPVIKEARITNSESIDRAQQVVTENPLKSQEIVTRLRTNPQERTISLEDSAVLLVERTRLNKERDALLDRATDPNLSPTEQEAAKTQFDLVETRLNELDQAAQDARSTWGRFGQLWQRSMRQDFTLEPMLRRARLQKGEALTAEETARIKTISDEAAVAQQAADVAVAKAEAAAVEKQVDATIGEIAKQPDLDPVVRSLADRIIAKLDTQANAARARLRERFKKVGSAPDPLIAADFTILAANRIAKGTIKASQWAAEMIREFGEEVRPYLEQAWNAASAKLDEMVNTGTGDRKKRATVKAKILDAGVQQERITAAIAARIKEGEPIESLGNYIDKLVESFVRGGVRDRDALVAAVKSVLEPLAPGITDRKVGELISGYGRATLLSKDPLKVIKRDLKGQLQQISKLEALAAKEPLKKTGPERRTPSDEERRLTKQVNEAKKAAGVVTTDPETQLKSTMDSARTRIGNEIKDLTFEIETGTRPATRTPIQYAEDIEIMRGLRDRLRQTLRELEGPQQITEEQRIAITTRGLQDSIAALESRIAGAAPKTKRVAPDTPEIRTLKAKRDALRAELEEMQAADALLQENRKAEALVRSILRAEAELAGTAARPGKVQGPESEMVAEARAQLDTVREAIQAKRDADPAVQQERMDAAEAAVERAIKKLDEQLQAGDLSVQRAPSRAGSQRLEDLRMQRDAMVRLRNQLRREARPKPNPLDVAIKARKSALKRQEADYKARIAKGDFGPRTRKPPVDISGDAEAMDALARVQAVKDRFAKLQKEWELKNRTKTEKVIDGIKASWDAVRNLKLSMDLSAPLQTAKAIAAHPIEGARAMSKGVRIFVEQLTRNSDTLAQREQQRIANSPNNKNGLYKDMKLDLSLGDKREENAASILERLADLESRWEDIPTFAKGLIKMEGQSLVKGAKGIAKALPKVIGLGIKASNAGFNAVANHMRARTADAILARWARRRTAPTKAQLELLGNEVNSATGKGGLRGEEGIRALLFAPNYYLSILKQLSFQPAIKAGIKHEGGVAREVLEEYVRAAASVTSILMLQHLFGDRDRQTLDPRSGDFARAKTDRGTSIDFTMGRGAYVTLGTQLVTGEKVNKKGRVEKQDRSSAFLNFLKGRLSREISAGLTTAAGNDFRGKPLDAAGLAKELVAPLSWQDVDKVLKREGLTRGTFIQMLNLLGVTHRLAD